MCHHTMCATTVERMGMEMADTGNNDDEQQWIATMLERLSHSQRRFPYRRQLPPDDFAVKNPVGPSIQGKAAAFNPTGSTRIALSAEPACPAP